MRIVERSVYRGPHLYSARPMIRIRIDLGVLEAWPTSRLEGFGQALVAKLPGLADHGCSLGKPGGFLRRMAEGTWIGHVIEHVAIELLSSAGASVTRGKTRSVRNQPGVYDIFYCYADETSGVAAGRAAIVLVNSLLPRNLQGIAGLEKLGSAIAPPETDIATLIDALRKLVVTNGLGPSTAAIVNEAKRRGIPVMRLNAGSLVQLGTGSRQRRIRASVTSRTSLIAAELAGDKHVAKQMLADIGLPVPQGELVRTVDQLHAAAARLGWPLVVKPRDGNQGRGVTTNIVDHVQLEAAFTVAAAISRRVVVEQMLIGSDHRLLVIDGRLVAVAERVPAHVIGNGSDTVAALI